MLSWARPGGCKDTIVLCQEALRERDRLWANDARSTPGNWSEICGRVADCGMDASELYLSMDGSWFDIGHHKADPFPAPYMYGYLTQESVLQALGVPVNYSEHSSAVSEKFQSMFDIAHGGFLDAAAYLLDSGIKVHMMYGDRDYACNWVGGEKASLAIPYSRAADFADAGYAPLLTKEGISGMTRQLGNYSFTRVFQSGHEVPSYQPIAAYEIFMRATFNRDIPTGLLPVNDNFATIGMKDTWSIKNVPPEVPAPKCYVLKPETCPASVWRNVEAGKAIVEDFFVVGALDVGMTIQVDKDHQKVIGKL